MQTGHPAIGAYSTRQRVTLGTEEKKGVGLMYSSDLPFLLLVLVLLLLLLLLLHHYPAPEEDSHCCAIYLILPLWRTATPAGPACWRTQAILRPSTPPPGDHRSPSPSPSPSVRGSSAGNRGREGGRAGGRRKTPNVLGRRHEAPIRYIRTRRQQDAHTRTRWTRTDSDVCTHTCTRSLPHTHTQITRIFKFLRQEISPCHTPLPPPQLALALLPKPSIYVEPTLPPTHLPVHPHPPINPHPPTSNMAMSSCFAMLIRSRSELSTTNTMASVLG